MSTTHRVSIAADVASQIKDWRLRFVSTVGEAKYRRAAGWAVDEVAKHAVLGIRKQFHKHRKSNTPWTESAIKYKRSSAAGLNAIKAGTNDAGLFSAVYVMPKQSTYLKYLFGVQDNTRLPGDVGLAQDKILIPFWQNITLTQGVQPTQYGGVPSGFLARLSREVAGTKAKARASTASRRGVYKGTITLHGQLRLAYIARPPRVPTGDVQQIFSNRRGGRVVTVGRKMRDIDHPRVLFLAVDRATYKPILGHPGRRPARGRGAHTRDHGGSTRPRHGEAALAWPPDRRKSGRGLRGCHHVPACAHQDSARAACELVGQLDPRALALVHLVSR